MREHLSSSGVHNRKKKLPTMNRPPTPMSVSGYLLDQSTLHGQTVTVEGKPVCLGWFSLCHPCGENQSVPFKANKLPRHDKATLLNSTGPWMDDAYGLMFNVNADVLGQVEAAGLGKAGDAEWSGQ